MKVHFIDNLVKARRDRMAHTSYSKVANIVNFLKGGKHRISPVEGESIFQADDGEAHIYFCQRRRANRFKHGVMRQAHRLAGEYHLDQIDVAPGGVFIDCGANIGELGFWSRTQGLAYIAFEPEPLESRCCDLNNFGGCAETRRIALWKDTKMISFYSLAAHGDSSIFDMSDNAIRTEVQAMKLDDALDYRTLDISGTNYLRSKPRERSLKF